MPTHLIFKRNVRKVLRLQNNDIAKLRFPCDLAVKTHRAKPILIVVL